ncbi:MAG: SDR family oxidoreductase [Burkholderiales bacterium]|nr:SDR family oxidoreductase [Burkholderiales bacterium]
MDQSTVTPRLAGKTLVVTGAGQGIGKAYAARLAQEGAEVLLVDINEQAVAAAVADLKAAGLAVAGRVADVADPRSVQRLAESLRPAHPRIHGLINNAAVFSTIKLASFWDIDPEQWDKVMAVNVRGAWLMVTALLPQLRAAGQASIVNIGSDAVWMGKPGYLHYVTSKAAIYGMTHGMARELGADGIRVNTLSPGFTTTEVPRDTFTQAQLDGIMNAQAFKRLADAGDMVGVAAFLMSDDSRWMTGQTFHVTGGLLFR